jgi:hypothetical protein
MKKYQIFRLIFYLVMILDVILFLWIEYMERISPVVMDGTHIYKLKGFTRIVYLDIRDHVIILLGYGVALIGTVSVVVWALFRRNRHSNIDHNP